MRKPPTVYYMVCEEHKECIHIAESDADGFRLYGAECLSELSEFLADHALCRTVRFLPGYLVIADACERRWEACSQSPTGVD